MPAGHESGVPLLDIDSGITWLQVATAIAGEDEARCADEAYEDDGVDDLLQTPVLVSGIFDGWPTIKTEWLSIDIGGDRWPHKSWRCLSDRNATALYLSAFIQEQELGVGAMASEDRECVSQLPLNETLSGAVATVLKGEHEFAGPDASEFFDEIADATLSQLFWCLPELAGAVIWSLILDEYGDALSSTEHLCLADAALAAAREPDVDRDALYRVLESGDFMAGGERHDDVRVVLAAGADRCLDDQAGQNGAADPADETAGSDGDDVVGEAGDATGFAGATGSWEDTVDTVWADLFGRYADEEWWCIDGTLSDDDVEELYDWPIDVAVESEEWFEVIFGCLGRDSAAYTAVAMLASEGEGSGLLLDPDDGECLRSAFSDFDLAALWGSTFTNDEYLTLVDSYHAAQQRCLPHEWLDWVLGAVDDSQAVWLWEFVTNEQAAPVAVSPDIWSGLVVASDYSGSVWAFDSTSGAAAWIFDVDDELSTPAVVTDGMVLVTSMTSHYGLDAVSGDLVWQIPSGGHRRGRPAVAQGTAYYLASGNAPDSAVVAVDIATGTQAWKSDVRASDLPLLFPILAQGNTVYVSDDRSVHALDTATGAIAWSAEVNPNAAPAASPFSFATMSTVDSAQAADGEPAPASCLRGTGEGYCAVALDAETGRLLWYWEHAQNIYGHAELAGRLDGAFFVALDGLHAVDARTGELLWSAPYTMLTGPPLSAGDTLYVVDLWGGLAALDARTGAQLWRLPEVEASSATMVLEDGVLYAASPSLQLLYAVESETGVLLWTAPATVAGGDQRGFAVHHGTVFVGYQDGDTGGVRALGGPLASDHE